ncbi:unnamed protein product, partial [Ectocarpus sp. 12 AP-2014]
SSGAGGDGDDDVGWLDRKAALSLETAQPSMFAARQSAAAAAAAAAAATHSASKTAAAMDRTGSGFVYMVMARNADSSDDDEDGGGGGGIDVGGEDGGGESSAQQQLFDSATRKFLESVYEVETGVTPVLPSVTPEALFLSACRALAYSVSSAATTASPIDSLRGYAAAAASLAGLGTEGVAATVIDHGDATRLRCLRLVAGVLRRAAGQAGLEETVRRKLAGSLAGTSATGPDGLSGTGAGAADATGTGTTPADTSSEAAVGGGGEDAAGAAAGGVDPSPADMAAAIAEVSDTELAALRAEVARRMQQTNLLAGLASFAGGREGDG